MKLDASEARNTTLGPSSAGIAYRRIGASSIQCCRKCGSTGAISVLM